MTNHISETRLIWQDAHTGAWEVVFRYKNERSWILVGYFGSYEAARREYDKLA